MKKSRHEKIALKFKQGFKIILNCFYLINDMFCTLACGHNFYKMNPDEFCHFDITSPFKIFT